jgi:hypothetical protein
LGSDAIKALADRVVSSARVLSPGDCKLLEKLAKKSSSGRLSNTTGGDRVASHRLRESLKNYFAYTVEGRRESHRLSLPLKSSELEMEANRWQLQPSELFWDAHCVGRPEHDLLRIVYTEPLFFFDNQRRIYVRVLDLNSEASRVPDDLTVKAERLLGSNDLVPSFHYQPSGEIGARNLLLAWLRNYQVILREHITVDSKASRLCLTETELWKGHLIALGNRRTNEFIRELQDLAKGTETPPFIVIEDHMARAGTEEFRDEPERAYAAVSRLPNKFGGVATLIAANHGRAAEKVAEFLTDDESLAEFYATCGISTDKVLPDRFQILFEVGIQDIENPVVATPIRTSFTDQGRKRKKR